MNWTLIAVLQGVNLPLYFFIIKFFFPSWDAVVEAIVYLFTPDWESAFAGELPDDRWATAKVLLCLFACAAVTFGEYQFVIQHHLFGN